MLDARMEIMSLSLLNILDMVLLWLFEDIL